MKRMLSEAVAEKIFTSLLEKFGEPIIDRLDEKRSRVTSEEIRTTWEDLYLDSIRNNRNGDPTGVKPGVVSLEALISMTGASEQAVRLALHTGGFVVDKNNNVVERGISVPPPQR